MELFWANAGIQLLLMVVLWIVSVIRRDASIIDPWWSIGFLLISANTAFMTGLTSGKLVLLTLVGIWAIRLWLHLLIRSIGKPEDVRYTEFRKKYGPDRYWWFSFFQVFLLQGTLVMIVSGPLQVAASADGPDDVSAFDIAGAIVFLVGFVFEAVGDWQLTMFRRDPSKKGQVLDTGLWGLTRHPNYFGDSVIWWGFWICTLDLGLGGLVTIFAPALMTFLLVRVYGVRMLDAQLARTRAGYAEYMKRTPGFFPGIHWP